MRLLLTGGGTGGHVYPGLVVLDWLRTNGVPVQPLWAGSHRGLERDLVARAGIEYVGLPAGALRGRSPIGFVHGIAATAAGVRAALNLVDCFRPEVILATGGYVSTPTAVAARLRGVPTVVYLPDVVPGWAVRALSRIASVVAVSTPEASRHLHGKIVVTGYPVRPGFHPRSAGSARAAFGLAPDRFTLTVVGGSLGARRLNDAILGGLERLLERGQILHLTGLTDFARVASVRSALPAERRERYHVAGYLDTEMPDALAAADLIVSRAGASVLGEYPAVGRGSLLVPGPFSSQIKNADYLVRMGASDLLPNDRSGEISDRVLELADKPARLVAMGEAARKLARPDAAGAIGRLLLDLAAA
ncbi:MAG: UDP-N-acetylglucosamine--N-acetylmuramyl-(pentapeptide) pyrophosphoryl-undecaprenol N-acetylglucosamine transferase [Dehalococcoidia bacterium]|nr:MAG: UDP-N-acetylglucosamine--N-acetylmuramyl-(pentapeptide) pyrophosphoryl-undecaprenol N-acetylglucosamine transferase [Dehalococcoidia bacterium]